MVVTRMRGVAGLVAAAVTFCALLHVSESAASESRDGERMVSLVIDLQAGFSADTVVVLVDGVPAFSRENVTTDYSIGRADSAEADVPAGTDRVTVEVRIPTQNVSGETTVDVANTPYIGVSSAGGRVEFRLSDTAFVYF